MCIQTHYTYMFIYICIKPQPKANTVRKIWVGLTHFLNLSFISQINPLSHI